MLYKPTEHDVIYLDEPSSYNAYMYEQEMMIFCCKVYCLVVCEWKMDLVSQLITDIKMGYE